MDMNRNELIILIYNSYIKFIKNIMNTKNNSYIFHTSSEIIFRLNINTPPISIYNQELYINYITTPDKMLKRHTLRNRFNNLQKLIYYLNIIDINELERLALNII